METRFRSIVTILILLVTINVFSQRRTIQKPHFDELHYLVCTCENKIAKSKLARNKFGEYQHNHAGVTCTLYEYEKCSKCGKTWIWHCMVSRPDDFTLKPADNKAKLLHKAVEDSCYTVEYFPVPSQGLCECTIKLKQCDQSLYCTVEGETGVYIVTKGHSETYLEKNGKKKKVFVTHEKPEGFTPVRGNNQ